jgi:hypothetical protein
VTGYEAIRTQIFSAAIDSLTGSAGDDVIYGKNEQRLAFDLVGQPIRLDYAVDLS